MDLNAPLGMTPSPPRGRRIVLLVGCVFFVGVVGGLAFALVRADPRGGRAYVVAELPPPLAERPRAPVLDTTPTGTVPPIAASAPSTASPAAASAPLQSSRGGSLEGGVMVYRGLSDGPAQGVAASKPLVINVTRALDDPLGKSRGPVTPGAKTAPTPQSPIEPRVAIFVSGMGLDAVATRTAIDTMPAAVTLAFLPYGATVAASVGAARSKGHEVLLQLPMRNEGGGSPGAHALRPDASAEALKDDLAWLMDRFSGYDGIANLLGAPVTADVTAMTLVLRAAAARHLFYLDDGTSRRSQALSLAADLNVEAVKADVVLDATADPAVVRANLDKLVALAKRKGRAIGMASGLPDHLGTIARFVTDMSGKGVVLVPVSAIARDGTPVQAAATR